MNRVASIAAPGLALAALVAGCASDRVASTEVENELTAVVIGSAEDTAVLANAVWVLSDSTGVLAAGTTDTAGAFEGRIPLREGELVLTVRSDDDTLVLVLPPSVRRAGDTLRAGVNLITDAVARTWRSGARDDGFDHLGDSLVGAITGFPLKYRDLAAPRGDRGDEARALLGALSHRLGDYPGAPPAYVDSLGRAPGGLGADPRFSRDLADALREQGLPPDSQTSLVRRLDSLGGHDGELVRAFSQDQARADSLLLVSLVPWTAAPEADGFRHWLLGRGSALGQAVLAQPRPAFDPKLVDETARRLALRATARALQDLSSPPDSAGRNALALLLDATDSTVRESFRILRIERWFGRDDQLDAFLAPLLLDRRRADWSTAALVGGADPAATLAAGWPLPHGADLRAAIVARASSGLWGRPSELLVPVDSTSP